MSERSLESYSIANDLKLCILNELLGTTEGVPYGFDACVAPGRITWDNCCPGMLRVAFENQYPTDRFPDPILRPTNCGAYQRATDLRVVVIRCAPGPNADGDPPTCEQLDKHAQIMAEDADAMWRGVNCCFGDTDFQYVIRSIAPVGPQGQCVGLSMLVTIGLTDWCGCGG